MIALLLMATNVSAVPLASSTFDSFDNGWRVGDFWGGPTVTAPTYFPANGNPGGFIRTADVYGWNGYIAPPNFLGNQIQAYGGSLHVEERIAASDNVIFPLIVLSNSNLSLQFLSAPPANNVWTAYDIPLVAAAGWQVGDGSGNAGPAATEAQLQEVLSSLTLLSIDADWHTGADQVDLDNVLLASRPGILPGDANFDGRIDADDYALIDRGAALHLFGYANGDFNGDGVINSLDYLILDQSFAQQNGTLASDISIPEPAAFLFLLFIPFAFHRQRTG
ncbi:MAG TPA: laminin B domain-containing protein [Tepidisphaeraceae bacterium]|jgi:hypothetical protein|nr:laminin B domain-containing protein [Tepidisphaeraceae bacterium]